MASNEQPPLPLLFLIGDTGGGHRSAADAVAQAMEHLLPGRFVPVICDPLRGPDVPRLLRWWCGLYGPCIRLTPWLWWLFWRASDSPRVLSAVRRTVMAPVYGSVARAAEACRPALIVAFHPMTADPAVRARVAVAGALATRAAAVPVATVITDLVTAHRSWRDAAVDRVIVPSAEIAARCAKDGMAAERYVPLGLPVAAEFCRPPLGDAERKELKRELGVDGEFLVVLTGGAEGSGGLRRRAAAIVRRVDNVDVAVICGRNKALKRRMTRLARRTERRSAGRPPAHAVGRALRRVRRTARPTSSRLTAHGFVGNMADWLRCADIVVGKAGPGTIAEATCSGAPLVLTSFVPGQEKGNAEFVAGAGAGVYAPRPRQLAAEIGRLRRDPAALAAMRDASARVGRPGAAADIARFLVDLARPAEASPDAPGAGEERAGLPPGERALLPALVGSAVARENALLMSLADAPGPRRNARASASLRRLRRSGVLIRAALRDR
jgi:1,2-diacylglycerol 3-beta-galactosyltransferase